MKTPKNLCTGLNFLRAGSCFFAALFTIAHASDFHSPRTAALGGAGHAGPMLNDSIFLNPSYASFMPTYSLGYTFEKYRGNDDHYYGRLYSASIQDGRSQLFQAGLGYTVREDGAMVHLGASRALLQQLGVGLGAKMYFPNDKNRSVVKDLTLSTTFSAMDWLNLSLIADNLFSTQDGNAAGFYREIIIGSKANIMGIVLAYFDPHFFPTRPGDQVYGFESGLEFPFMQDLFLRLGAFKNANLPYQAALGRGYSIGVGWVAPRLSLDYAIQRTLEWKVSGLPATTAHVFGATAYF